MIDGRAAVSNWRREILFSSDSFMIIHFIIIYCSTRCIWHVACRMPLAHLDRKFTHSTFALLTIETWDLWFVVYSCDNDCVNGHSPFTINWSHNVLQTLKYAESTKCELNWRTRKTGIGCDDCGRTPETFRLNNFTNKIWFERISHLNDMVLWLCSKKCGKKCKQILKC